MTNRRWNNSLYKVLYYSNIKLVFFCYYFLSFGLADASYSDPLGPQVERPKTAARRREDAADDFADEELDEDLLPD